MALDGYKSDYKTYCLWTKIFDIFYRNRRKKHFQSGISFFGISQIKTGVQNSWCHEGLSSLTNTVFPLFINLISEMIYNLLCTKTKQMATIFDHFTIAGSLWKPLQNFTIS